MLFGQLFLAALNGLIEYLDIFPALVTNEMVVMGLTVAPLVANNTVSEVERFYQSGFVEQF